MYESGDSESECVEIVNIGEDQWSQLPSLTLEKIYNFLSRKDQCQMSLVCKRWSKEYSSPSIWKNFKFCLSDCNQFVDICPEVRFARKYANMFQNVEVTYSRFKSSIIDTIYKQLKLFLTALTHHSQLLSVRFTRTGIFLRHLNDSSRLDMFGTFVEFLKCQRYLRTVEFHGSHFSYEESAEVLTAITSNSGKTIRKLILHRFADLKNANSARSEAITNSLSCLLLEKLSNLNSLETDYSEIFESLLLPNPNVAESFMNTKHYVLSKIILHCDGAKETSLQGIPSTVWRRLKETCCHLVVDFYFTPGSQPQQEIQFYMVPHMPLRLVECSFDYHSRSSANMQIDVLFNHLHHIGCHLQLEELNLIWMQRIPDLPSVLIPFLQRFPLIKSLQLSIRHPVNHIELMLQSWLEVRPKSLEQVVISISCSRNQEHYYLNSIANEYVPVLQAIGLNVYILLEFGR